MSRRTMEWRYRVLDTPTGAFILAQSQQGELRTGWSAAWCDDHAGETEWLHVLGDTIEDASLLPELTTLLQRYFDGERVSFDHVPTPTGSPFQVACWEVCRQIPRGSVATYGELALRAGSNMSAARAAGQAMRRNPLPIIVPCHRVVGSSGLHGFAGSSDPASENLAVKQWLLSMEGAILVEPRKPTPEELAGIAAS